MKIQIQVSYINECTIKNFQYFKANVSNVSNHNQSHVLIINISYIMITIPYNCKPPLHSPLCNPSINLIGQGEIINIEQQILTFSPAPLTKVSTQPEQMNEPTILNYLKKQRKTFSWPIVENLKVYIEQNIEQVVQ